MYIREQGLVRIPPTQPKTRERRDRRATNQQRRPKGRFCSAPKSAFWQTKSEKSKMPQWVDIDSIIQYFLSY